MRRRPRTAVALPALLALLAACSDDGTGGGDGPEDHEWVLEADAGETGFTLTHPDFPSLRLADLSPALHIAGETYTCADYPQRDFSLTSVRPSWRLTCTGHDVAPELLLDIEQVDGTTLELRASTKGSLTDLRGFDVLATDGGLALADDVAQLSNGFQSWSNSGVIRLPASPPRDGLAPLLAERGDDEVMREGRYLSWWFTALAAEGGPTLAVGSTTARLFRSSVAAYGTGDGAGGAVLRLISGLTGESVDAAECEQVESETFRLVLGDDVRDTLRRYGEALGPPRPGSGPGARGWNSWYEHWFEVSAEDIRGSAAVAAAQLTRPDEDFVVVVDDGWERGWGDWQANERFPDGMPALAAELKAQGLTPGLWLAPLLVDQDSALVTEHPDWFVRGEDDAPLYYPHLMEGRQLILDVTHPDVATHLELLMATVAQEWGFEVLKLDFLFAGAYEGKRQQPVTGMQAYSLALQTLRRGMGEDTYFLACGAPLLGGPRPLAYDAIRTGADIAYEPTGLAWSFVTTEARNTAARSFLHGAAFAVDADPPLVRPPFTADEAWTMIVSVLVSGGLLFASDALPALPDERLNLLADPAIAQVRGLPSPAAEPLGLLSTAGLPEYLVSPYEDYIWSQGYPGQSQSVQPWLWRWDDGAGGQVLALFAWGPDGHEVDLALAELGLDSAASAATLGPGPAATLDAGRLQVSLAGHQAVLVHLTP